MLPFRFKSILLISVKKMLQSACTKRVEDDDTGSKHCTGQYFDYWGCIDKCAATKLFNKLK
ncbi:hypothetical protein Mapa_016524 [Marchantia paleacea]|nr:hypothetical protein Mapa_016524 [Marchantia paleacea]